jgi:hypothetical protein
MTALRQRQPRIECPGFLAFIRTRPCCSCGATGRTQAAHVRFGSAIYGKRAAGGAEKPSDMHAVPLCGPLLGVSPGCHAVQHSMNEQQFWLQRGIDPLWVASQLWARYALEHPAEATRALSDVPPSKASRPAKRAQRPRQTAKIAKRKVPWPKGRRLQSRGFRK